MTHFPKRKPRVGVPKKLKRRYYEIRARRRWRKNKIKINKKKNNVTIFILLKKVDSIDFYPRIEKIDGMTPY